MDGKTCLLALSLLLLSTITQAATLRGTTYGPDFEALSDVVVDVNSTPRQSVVAKGGNYSLTLPPGAYLIEAKYYRNGVLTYSSSEWVSVTGQEGTYNLDLILVPSLEEEKLFEDYPTLDDMDLGKDECVDLMPAALAAVVLIAAASIILYLRKRKPAPVADEGELPDDLKSMLDVIKNCGGRITQLELRSRFGYSEAKISLMVADLKDRGRIRKIKRGRGNVIILEGN